MSSTLPDRRTLSPEEKRKLLAQLLQKKAQQRTQTQPLSAGQQALWFLHQLEPDSWAYNTFFVARVLSPLDVPALRRALQTLLQRHPPLRATFGVQAGEPVGLIHEQPELVIEEHDVAGLSEPELLARLVEVGRSPFDLERGPLFRTSLFHCGPQNVILLLGGHHSVIDLVSYEVLLNELAALYPLELAGRSTAQTLAPQAAGYADFVAWQRELLASPRGAELLAYWERQLAGPLPTLQLPTDRPRPAVPRRQGAGHRFQLPAELSQRLKALARAEGVTLFMLLLAGFQALLSRYSNSETVLVGAPVSGRSHPAFESLVGYFVNPVVLRGDLGGNPPFRSFLAQVRATVSAALDHQDYPFPLLVERLQPPRPPGRSPFFDVMFALESAHLQQQGLAQFLTGEPGYRMEFGGLLMETVPLAQQEGQFDLLLHLFDGERAISGTMLYDTALFDAPTIARMLGHLETLLAGVADDPARRIADLPLLTPAELHTQLGVWNQTGAPFSNATCLHTLFEAQAAATPEATAVIDSGRSLSYGELNRRANQLAHALRGRGVTSETTVGVYIDRSIELVVALLGVLKAGGHYLPLDPSYPAERLAYMLADARPLVVLEAGGQSLAADEAAPEHRAVVQATPRLDLVADWAVIAAAPADDAPGAALPDTLAYIIYTSGSTGRPKGTMISHRAIVNHMLWMQRVFPLAPDDRVIQKTPLSFDAAGTEFYMPLLSGAQLVLAAPGGHKDTAYLARTMIEQRVTTLQVVPSLLRALLDEPDFAGCRDLRRVICAGEALQDELMQRFIALHGPRLYNLYGPTEAAIDVSWWPCRLDEPRPVAPIGRPVDNTQIYILDAALRPTPVGVPGEIYIGGAQLARGYLGRPDLTAEKFVPNPFGERWSDGTFERWSEGAEALDRSTAPTLQRSNARLYRTGDLGLFRPDGTVEFLGRIDGQIKLRGFRIEIGEIEAVLGRLPGVRQATVVMREDAPGDKRLVAYVVQEPRTKDQEPPADEAGSRFSVLGSRELVAELKAELAARLPDYMVPSAFVLLEALPLTPNGKIDRKALPAPTGEAASDAPFVAPRTPVEELLAGIWAEVLRVERVGVHDDFFVLGGHSLLATQVMSRVRDTLRIDLPLRALFEAPTVAGLGGAVARERPESAEPRAQIPRVPRDGPLPLSFAQQRLWVLTQLAPESPIYNLPMIARLTGPLDLPALEQTLALLVRRHEALRTRLVLVDDQPAQVIDTDDRVPLELIDLSGLPAAEAERAGLERLSDLLHRPFDLAQDRMLRACAVRLDAERHLLLMMIHHVAADGWSSGVLLREIALIYGDLTVGAAPRLPEPPIQYADYALWQRGWLQGPALERQVAYWRRQLDRLPTLELPTDYTRPAVATYAGATLNTALSPELTAALKALSRREGVTLFMTLLAAFDVLLARYSGQSDIVVGTPIANRTRTELEGLVGFLSNTLVLRADLADNPTFRGLLAQVRRTTLDAYAHQDVPFEHLVSELQPERDMSRNPLFQVLFNYLDPRPAALPVGGATLELLPLEGQVAKFDLTLTIGELDDRLHLSAEYSTDLFAPATLAQMLRSYQRLLEEAAARPQGRVAELALLSEPEQAALLRAGRGAPLAPPPAASLHALIEAQADRDPAAPALECDGQRLTYGELERRANQLAHALRGLGVGPDAPVGICMERSIDLIVSLVAALKAGGAYLPLDPNYPPARLALMVEDARPRVVLTAADGQAGAPAPEWLGGLAAHLPVDWGRLSSQPDARPAPAALPGHLAYVIYTSGSTGTPKGAGVTHAAAIDHFSAMAHVYGLTPADRVLQFASPSFDISLEQIFPTLIAGACLTLRGAELWGPDECTAELERRGVTVANLPTAYWHQWAQALGAEPPAGGRPKLRTVVVGGDAMLPEAARRWRASWLGHVPLLNAYGPAEATVTALLYELPAALDALMHRQAVPLGRPLPNRAIYILDRGGAPVPAGVPGELYIGGPHLARGYLNRPELTAERFVPNPFAADQGPTTKDESRTADGSILNSQFSILNSRLYRTGDLARWLPDGTVEFLGRRDHQVKVRGFRVELGEIESALARHPAVREVTVVARSQAQGERQLVAYVVPADEGRRTKDEAGVEEKLLSTLEGSIAPALQRSSAPRLTEALRQHLAGCLPAYMIPSALVLLDAMPLTPNGKVDRAALPAPDGARPELDQPFVGPRSPLEAQVAEIWADILGLSQVGVLDNFFELGGNSLLATQIVARANRTFEVQLSLRSLFEAPSVAGMAEQLFMHTVAQTDHDELMNLLLTLESDS